MSGSPQTTSESGEAARNEGDGGRARPGFLTGESKAAAATAIVVALGLMFVVSLVPIRSDNDCWWHVKTGQVLAERFAAGEFLPKTDVFSYTAADHEWHNHEWLTQWAMHGIFRAGEATGFGGWRMVILAKSFVLCAWIGMVLVLARRLSRNWWIALLVAVLAVAIGRRTYYPRPPVLSNFLLEGLLVLLVFVQNGWLNRKWMVVIPPLFALWTNLHGAWMAGAVILAAFAGGDVLARAPKLNHVFETPPSPLPIAWWLVLGGLTILATFANPYGWRLYELPARVLGDRELVQAIGELQPPILNYTRIFVAYLVVMAILLIVGIATRRFRPRFGEAAVFAFFLYQGLEHVRHLLLFAVAMTPMTARLLGALLDRARDGDVASLRVVLPRMLVLPVALAVTGLTLVNYPFHRSPAPGVAPDHYLPRFAEFWRDADGYENVRFPAELCDFVELARLEGRMFNENHYAGYLIWRLSPEQHLVFSDPRFDIFGGEIWRKEAIVALGHVPEQEGPSWRSVLDDYDVQWAIARKGAELDERMSEDESGWTLVADFSRVQALPQRLYIRDTPENSDMIDRAQRTAATLGRAP